MADHNTIFPPQKLPLRKKTKEWKEQSLEGIISRRSSSNIRKANLKIAYDIMNSEFDMNDLKYVTDPYKVSEGFPAKMQNINIIRPKIELLKGEQTKRPDSLIVYRTDEAAVDAIVEKEKEMMFQTMQEVAFSGADMQNEEVMNQLQSRMAKIKEYIGKEYYDPAEKIAEKALKYLKEKLNLPDEFLNGWEDMLVGGEVVFYHGIVNGDPLLERTNPIEMDYDPDPNLKNIDQGDWATRHTRMTAASLYDRLYDKMDEDQLDKLLEYIEEGSGTTGKLAPNINTEYIVFKNVEDFSDVADRCIDVYHGAWKSYKKIGYLDYIDEYGEEQKDMVDETYKAQEGEDIVWDWIIEWWEGYRIGEDMYIGIEPIEYQGHSIDSPNATACPYSGVVCNYNNSTRKSLVEIMKPLQYLYLVLWYRLELALARDKGKIFMMDITQIPKGMGIDENKFMHYLTSMGVGFFNPYDEGWNVPGREGGKPASFNQFTSIDLSMSKVIAEYVQLLDKVETMVGELSGVSKARQGQIHHAELVGNVEREVIQSSHITEPLFWKYNQAKRRALTHLLNITKFAWKMNDKKKLNFILEGPERVFLEITDDFLFSEHDIFVGDSTKEHQNIESLKTLYQPAMQNGATLLDIAEIMTEDSISDIKNKLGDIEKKKAEMQQQMMQQEQAAVQQESQMKQEELRIKEEDSIRKSNTAIEVALINAESKEGDGEVEEPEEDNSLEYEKLDMQQEKNEKDNELRKRQLDETIRSNKAKEQIARSKPKPATTKK